MSVVLDANVLVVLALDRQRAPAVEARLREWRDAGADLHAPALQRYEAASALSRAVAAGHLPTSEVTAAWEGDARRPAGSQRRLAWALGSPHRDVTTSGCGSPPRCSRRLGLGYTLYALGDYRGAYRHLGAYVELTPQNAWSWCWLGHACIALGELGEARSMLEKAVELKAQGSEGSRQL